MKLNYNLFIWLFLGLTACKKESEVVTPNFEVSVDKMEVKAGEPIQFSFKGDPGIITFYSGEVKSDYEYKDIERIDKIDNLTMSFDTHSQLASSVPLRIRFSTDFNGIYDYDNVIAGQWEDITDRFVLAEPAVYPNGWQPSGVVDVTDLLVDGKPFYVAFEYDAPEHTAAGSVPTRRWRFRNFRLESITTYGLEEALAFNTAGTAEWQFVIRELGLETPSSIPSARGTIILFAPPLSTKPGFKDPMQLWAITKAFSADEVNLGVDRGVAIKDYQSPTMTSYEYIFEKEGTYKAKFVAANTTIYDSKEVVKEIEITVTP